MKSIPVFEYTFFNDLNRELNVNRAENQNQHLKARCLLFLNLTKVPYATPCLKGEDESSNQKKFLTFCMEGGVRHIPSVSLAIKT